MKNLYSVLVLLIVAFLFSTPVNVLAANISSPSYAWSESVGWIKFDSGVGAVTVTNNALSGHAYNDNIGWIVLDGVTHDGAGTLSGYAWSESVGYIDFGDVTILDGEFYGYAYNDNIGFISFNCDNTDTCGDVDYKVSTTWTLPADTSSSSSGRRRDSGRRASPVSAPIETTASTSSSTLRQSITTPTQRDLTLNFEGQDVLNLQRFLNAQGFTLALTGPGSVGNETTYFGALTRAALARFQAANGILPSVGYFGPLTRAFISSMK